MSLKYRVNDQIRISPVLVVKEDGERLGVMSAEQAKKIARDIGMDLVEVSPSSRPPVCRIMDYGKFKYSQTTKKKQKTAHSQPKELMITPVIGEHDIEVKLKAARKFLTTGHTVTIKLIKKKNKFYAKIPFAHKQIGYSVIKKLTEDLADVSVIKKLSRLEEDPIIAVLEPKKS